jgi:molybdopterin synthase sulfur carrier subunit
MNKYTIKAFGVTKDILGGREVAFEMEGKTVGELRTELSGRYPKLIGLKSLYIAVNNNYAEESKPLAETDEIALIPPVSGG